MKISAQLQLSTHTLIVFSSSFVLILKYKFRTSGDEIFRKDVWIRGQSEALLDHMLLFNPPKSEMFPYPQTITVLPLPWASSENSEHWSSVWVDSPPENYKKAEHVCAGMCPVTVLHLGPCTNWPSAPFVTCSGSLGKIKITMLGP